MQTPWDNRYALRMRNMKASAIRELLKVTSIPGIISFGGGLPGPDVFPIEEFKDACMRVLNDQSVAAKALQYSESEGVRSLREMIARHTTNIGIEVGPENILITSGSQQALDLIGKVFINPGDRILVESPTYLGALQAWNAYEAQYVTVPSDENGMNVDGLEEALRSGPKFIYVLPNFQNPTGVTIPLERRKKIVELADKYGVPIIEDDPYGQLRFEGEHLPAIEVLDSQSRNCDGNYTGNVIYLSTFSKTLSPGLRLAWVIAPAEVISKLVTARQGTDLHPSTFNQYVAYEVGKGGFIDRHVKTINKVYSERRDAMLDALEEHMPDGVKWTHPEGGLFLWVTLPEPLSSNELFKIAIQEKVAFVSGESFYPNGGGSNTMRLNFSYEKPPAINEGISRLGKAIKRMLIQ